MGPSIIRSRAARAKAGPSRANTIAPATTSEWPLRYLVAECSTISAPSARGRVSTGVDTVELMANSAPAACAHARRFRDIRDDPGRVRRCLDPDKLRAAGPDCRAERARVPRVDEGHLQPVARRILGQPLAQAPVHRRRGDHVRGPLQAEERGRCRGHAGREQQARCAALDLRQDVFDLSYRGIVGAAVAVAPAVLVVRIANEGRGHMDRRNDRAGGGIHRAPALGGHRLGAWAARAMAARRARRHFSARARPIQSRRGRRFWRAPAVARSSRRVVTRCLSLQQCLRGIR